MKYWVVFTVSFELNPYTHAVPKIRTFYGNISEITGEFVMDEFVQYHYDEPPRCKILVLGTDGKEHPAIAKDLDEAFWKYHEVRS